MNGKSLQTEVVADIAIARQLYEAVALGKPEKAQLFFAAEVLDSYRGREGYRIIRTDSSGRVSKQGGWHLDFGISGDEDNIIHIAVEGFIHRLPEGERAHWLEHMLTLPVSRNFLKGLVRPGCIDDGMIRAW